MKTVVLTRDNINILFQEKNQLKLCLGDDGFGNIVSQPTSKNDNVFCTKNKQIKARTEDSELNLFNDITPIKEYHVQYQ